MKFSDMLLREDFWKILEDTLNANTQYLGIKGEAKVVDKVSGCTLFANAQLNAIMSAHPSKSVVDYLRTEYSVSGSLLRRMIVKGYLFAATSFVKRFSQKGLKIEFDTNVNMDDILIYPCNKKIRLFDFGKGVVYTILKRDFPTLYIDRETKFRVEHKATFIPEIMESGKGWYSEKIINGIPLARINNPSFVERCKEEAIKMVVSLTKVDYPINACEYIQRLKLSCLEQLKQKPSFKDSDVVACLFDSLFEVQPNEKLSLVVSHGDFQPGNIWYDEDNKKVVIIDWETIKMRSPFYDYAALYYNLRRKGMLQHVADSIKNSYHIANFSSQCSSENIAKVVFAEELAYQTEELISFPGEIGIKEYEAFINQVLTVKI